MPEQLIEKYYTTENGYHPFFIRDHWQVAQLNYLPQLSFTTIEQLDLHQYTDEIFVLTKGTAVLIAASIENNNIEFECINMVPGVTYNVPVNTWHNIAMNEAVEIIIVEKSNTHEGDCLYHPLSAADRQRLNNGISKALSKI
jgi:mannose-6-phosphate isomerase-like protein (cupin superfamily)